MTTPILRFYQRDAVSGTEFSWCEHDRVVGKIGTGGGKTVVAAELIARANGERVAFVGDQSELVFQPLKVIRHFANIVPALDKAREVASLSAKVVVASAQTWLNPKRLERYPINHFQKIILDEAHRSSQQKIDFINHRFPAAKVLAITATPFRSGMRDLSKWYSDVPFSLGMLDLCDMGFAPPIKAVSLPIEIDLEKVGTSRIGGEKDYKAEDLDTTIEPYYMAICEAIREYAKDRFIICFLPLIKSSVEFVAILRSYGIKARHVDGKSKDREEIIESFSRGEFNVLCNSSVCSTGIDIPRADCILNLRPTASLGLYQQCMDKNTTILTKNGFIGIDDVAVGQECGTVNPETGAFSWERINQVFKRTLGSESAYMLKSPGLNMRVTAGHRMVASVKRGRSGREWKILTAEELAAESQPYQVRISSVQSCDGIPLNDFEIRLIGYAMTDGNIAQSGQLRLFQSEKHPAILNRFRECIDKCNLKYSCAVDSRDTNYKRNFPLHTFTISRNPIPPSGKRGWSYLEKYISRDFSMAMDEMNGHQFEVFLNAINDANGTKQLRDYKSKGKSWIKRSFGIKISSTLAADRIQSLAVRRGYKCNIRKAGGCWVLNIKRATVRLVGGTSNSDRPIFKKVKASPSEIFWCVSNRVGTLISRRDGSISVIGNCIGRITRVLPGVVDDIPEENQSEERRARILSSAKPNAMILDCIYQNDRLKSAHAGHLIARDEEEANAIYEKMKKERTPEELQELARRVQEEKENRLVAAIDEAAARKHAYDPAQIGYLLGDPHLADYDGVKAWQIAKPSDKQLGLLQRFGVDVAAVAFKGLASDLIGKLIFRAQHKFATLNQVALLRKYNIPEADKVTSYEAARIIKGLAKK